MAKRDFLQVKDNVLSMQKQGAPDTDIDQYLSEEGWTPDEFLKTHESAQSREANKANMLPSDVQIPFKTPDEQYNEITKQSIANRAAISAEESKMNVEAAKKQEAERQIGQIRPAGFIERNIISPIKQHVLPLIPGSEAIKTLSYPLERMITTGETPSDVTMRQSEQRTMENLPQAAGEAGLMYVGGKVIGKVGGEIIKANPVIGEAIKSLTPDLKGIYEWMTKKEIKIPVTPDDVKATLAGYETETGRKVSPEVADFLSKAENKADILRRAAKGETITMTKKVPRWGGEKTPGFKPTEAPAGTTPRPSDIVPFSAPMPVKTQSGAVSRAYKSPLPSDVPIPAVSENVIEYNGKNGPTDTNFPAVQLTNGKIIMSSAGETHAGIINSSGAKPEEIKQGGWVTPEGFKTSNTDVANIKAKMEAQKRLELKKQPVYYQHKILRDVGDIPGIMKEGFKFGIGPNAMPVYKGGKPSNIMQERYAPRKGDTVILIPKSAIINSPNGPKIKVGYKPSPDDIVKIQYDYQSPLEAKMFARYDTMSTQDLEKLIDKAYEKGLPQKAIDELETAYSKRVTDEEQNIGEGYQGSDVNSQLIAFYKEYVLPQEKRVAKYSDDDLLTNIKANLEMYGHTLGGGIKGKLTKEKIIVAAKDVFEYKQKLLEKQRKAFDDNVLQVKEQMAFDLDNKGQAEIPLLAPEGVKSYPQTPAEAKNTVIENTEPEMSVDVKTPQIYQKSNISIGLEQTGVIMTGKAYIKNSLDAADLLIQIKNKNRERLMAIYLDANDKVISTEVVGIGGIASTTVNIEVIGQKAALVGAKKLYIAHNHPSGMLEPSKADKDVTLSIKRAMDGLGVELKSHMITNDGILELKYSEDYKGISENVLTRKMEYSKEKGYSIPVHDTTLERKGAVNVNLRSSKEAYDVAFRIYKDINNAKDKVWVNFLNIKNSIISIAGFDKTLSGRELNSEILKYALKCNSSALLITKYEPAPNSVEPDKESIKSLISSASAMQILVQDYINVSETGYFSMADNGLLSEYVREVNKQVANKTLAVRENTPDWITKSDLPENLKTMASELQAKEGKLAAQNNIRLAMKSGALFVEKPIPQMSVELREKVAAIAKWLMTDIIEAERPGLIRNEGGYGKKDTFVRSKSGMPAWAQDLQQTTRISYDGIVSAFRKIANGQEPQGFLGKQVKREVFSNLIIAVNPADGSKLVDMDVVKKLAESNVRLTTEMRQDIRKALEEGGVTPDEVVRQILSNEVPRPFDNMVDKQTNLKLKALKEAAKLGKMEGISDERTKRLIQVATLKAKNMANMQIVRDDLKAKLDETKSKIKDIKSIQATLIKYAKMALPREERGSVLTVLRDTKTPSALNKAFEIIDTIAENNLRKEVVSQIKDYQAKKDRVYIGNQEKIDEILKNYNFKKMNASRVNRITNTQDYLWKSGKSASSLPVSAQRGLNQMWARSIDTMDTSELIELRNQVGKLFNEGLVKLAVKRRIEKLRIEAATKQILENAEATTLDVPEMRPAKIGGSLKRKEAVQNNFLTIKRLAKSADVSLMYMDRFFNLLDGWKPGYDGPLSNFIKAPIDEGYSNKERLHEPILSAFYSLENKFKLKQGSYDRIGVHAAREQRNGIEKLVQSGYTIPQIREVALNPQEIEMYNFMRNTFERLFGLMDKVSRDVDNVALRPEVNYFPMKTDYDNPEAILDKKIEEARVAQRTKDTKTGSLISRKANARQVIKIDARSVFLNAVRENLHYITNERNMRSINKIVDNSEFKAKYGPTAVKRIVNYLTLIAKDGTPPNPKDIPALDWMRRRAAPAYLMLSIGPYLKQYIALTTMGAEIGAGYVKQGAMEVLSKANREFVFKASPEILQRVKKYNELFVDENSMGALKSYEDFASLFLRQADGDTAIAGWLGAYHKRLDDIGKKFNISNVDEKAARYADRMVRLTMGSGRYKDLPPALTGNSRSLGKTVFIFASFMLNDFGFMKNDVILQNLKKENPGYLNLIRALIWLALGIGLETTIDYTKRKVFAKPRSKESSFAEEYASNMASRIPVAGQLAQWVKRGDVSHPMLDNTRDIVKNVAGLLSDDEEKRFYAMIREMEAVAKLTGVPGSSQASQIINTAMANEKANSKSAQAAPVRAKPAKPKKAKRAR